MKTSERTLFALIAALLLLPSVQSSAQGDRYKVAACDWMMLKRQKPGEFQLASRVGLDGVELDMGSLGNREMFDSRLRDRAGQDLFLAESAKYGIPVCAGHAGRTVPAEKRGHPHRVLWIDSLR